MISTKKIFKMKKRILVKIDDYKNYLTKYNTNELDKNNVIYTFSSFPPKFYRKLYNINEEIFDGTICDYEIINKNSNIINIIFISKLNNEYRLDLFKEPNVNIWHIGFSEFNSEICDIEKYHKLTNNNESIDVFSRLIWILQDINLNVKYCIGASGDPKKDRVYEYMMRFVSNWEKKETDQYPLGWAIYFHL